MSGADRLPAALPPHRVFCARAPHPDYDTVVEVDAPELPGGVASTVAQATVRALLRDAGLDAARFGTADWNPLGEVVPRGGCVLVKPNWVKHHNHSGAGLDSLVTHSSVLEAVSLYVLLASPGRLVLGDAPVQGCDWDALDAGAGIGAMAERLRRHARGATVEVSDFRRTVLEGDALENRGAELRRTDADYVLFDLGTASDLEPVTDEDSEFRVTMYDPDALRRTHSPGRHQYLIAREAIDADVVINVPKLKSHKKACVTGALKNMVGINGHKEYLPHHRKGGASRGGDCYEGGSPLKAATEQMLDVANRTESRRLRYFLPRFGWLAVKLGVLLGDDANIEGSWHGNDTVWRMCLDLQRVLHYGRADGTLADTPQRTVLTLTDAIVAGEGEGPLSPTPVPLGILTLGTGTAALEWVHALLMGWDPARIPLTRNAFADHTFPLAGFPPESVEVVADGEPLPLDRVPAFGHPFRPPAGWVGHCELQEATW